jgi:excisionase family DNA binding protein
MFLGVDILSVVQAAAELGITRRRVNALIAAGRLPAAKVGKYYVVRRADLAKVKDRRPGRPPVKSRSSKGRGK